MLVRWVAEQVEEVRAFDDGLHRHAVLALEVKQATHLEVAQRRPDDLRRQKELAGESVGQGLDVVDSEGVGMQCQVAE